MPSGNNFAHPGPVRLSARTVNGVFGPCIERRGGGIPKGAGFRFADATSVTISMRKHLFAALARPAGPLVPGR